MQLIKATQRVTIASRIVSVIVFLVGTAVHFGWIPADQAAGVIAYVNGETFAEILAWVLMGITLFLPSVAGWLTKERELPQGVTISDVAVRSGAPNAGEKASKLHKAAAAVVLVCLMPLVMAGCAGRCANVTTPQTGEVVHYDSRR